MINIVPTFETDYQHNHEPQEIQITNETPLSKEINRGSDFMFVFLIDCSGSMTGDRIETAIDALKLFIQSLPLGSKFSIIQFGTNYGFIKDN